MNKIKTNKLFLLSPVVIFTAVFLYNFTEANGFSNKDFYLTSDTTDKINQSSEHGQENVTLPSVVNPSDLPAPEETTETREVGKQLPPLAEDKMLENNGTTDTTNLHEAKEDVK